MKLIRLVTIVAFSLIFFNSCVEENTNKRKDLFDREAMLEKWVDLFIVPGYNVYNASVQDLSAAYGEFIDLGNEEALQNLRKKTISALHTWQDVSMFEIGEAERLGLRGYTNTFPTNTEKIEANIESANTNLALPSLRDAQGFPALDYLLFRPISEESLVLSLGSAKESDYLESLISRLLENSAAVKTAWDAEERATFTENPESVDRMVNDFIFYYERFLRAGKVGIPAGVFSSNPLPGHVEAPFSEVYSKDFLITSINAIKRFFNAEGSLHSYLDFMEKEDIADEINQHWDNALLKLDDIDSTLKNTIDTNPLSMLEVYDDLQKAVVLLKVDMLQALSIQVDYVDADGD